MEMMHIIDRTVLPQEASMYANNDNEEDQEMSPFNNMIHQSNGSNGVIGDLFSGQSTNGHGPLGLNLKKTASVLNSIQKKLAPASKVKGRESTRTTVIQGMKPSKKLRASHFQASVLKVGDWELKSRYKGDIVAKFYFSQSKMVWETIQEGLKKKMEIKCADICALKISCPKKLPGMLDITVSAEPQFFREANSVPYRSTRWVVTTDFTGGQARRHRHVLQCDPGIIDKHIENLLSRDNRLYLLSQENNIAQKSPCLATCCSVPGMPLCPSNANSYHSDDDNLFGTARTGQSLPTGTKRVGLNDSGALQSVHFQSSVAAGTSVITEEPSMGVDQLKSDMFSWEEFFEMTMVAQKPFMSNGGLMNGKGKHINNLANSEDSHRRVDYSSRRAKLPEMITRFPVDRMTSRQVKSGNQPSHTDHVVLYPSSEEPSGQTLLQNQPINGYISPETMALEQIRENLLTDNEDVNVEQQDLMSTVNSLSCLIGQAAAVAPLPPPPDVEPPQVINVGDQFSPWMEWPSSPWEPSPEDAEILASLSQLFPLADFRLSVGVAALRTSQG